MGCGASKTNAVAPESATIETRPKPEPPQTTTDKVQVASPSEPVTAENNAPPSPTPSEKSTSSRISVRSKQSSTRPGSGRGKSSMRKRFEKLRQDGVEMKDSSEGHRSKSERGPSAISADSGYTADSEIGPFEDGPPSADREEEESANSQEEAAEECPSPPDLTVQGVAIRSRKSHSATRRHQGSLPPLTPISLKAAVKSSSTPVLSTDPPSAQDQLEEPLTPGFGRSVSFADKVEVISPQMIERPASRGGLAFDLQFTPDTGNVKRTPSRVKQLDRARKCKSADVLRRELEERMQAAEDRKKASEQMLLQRLAASKTKEAKVQSTLKDNVQSQSERTESLLSRRMESTQENREAHLKALRDRLQAKKEHSEKVRQTKMSPLRPPPGPALAAAY